MRRRAVALLAVLAGSFPLTSQVVLAGTLDLETGYHWESLSRGLDPWQTLYTTGTLRPGDRRVVFGSLRQVERFSLIDRELVAGVAAPWGPRFVASLEGSYSPTAQVLPTASGLGQLSASLGDGWGAEVGWKRTVFPTMAFDRQMLTLERYWSAFRVAYTFSVSQLPGGQWPTGHQGQLTRYYGESNRVGLVVGRGEELLYETPIRLTRMDVRALALTGQHWFTTDWALSYEWSWLQQGDAYSRTGPRLGIVRQW